MNLNKWLLLHRPLGIFKFIGKSLPWLDFTKCFTLENNVFTGGGTFLTTIFKLQKVIVMSVQIGLAAAKSEHAKGRHVNIPVNYLTYDQGSRHLYNLITSQHNKHPRLPSLEMCILIVTLKLKSTKHHPWRSVVNMTCCVCNLWANLHIKAQLSSSRNHSESIGITTRALLSS